ncbi:MAG: hypothetical protein A2381_17290 [Bdellovibrionales bacterium RIFOXYB1_FULL_37_110]|nr:MAG: hypothetical protein A2181_08295 [Bdellovibrionales bacterium RIFOXYA1_FULL_38_20]OFZ50150.1 MAG: hypothetical protein A2417_19125 [Bdellovibrionales bacterium RIFOXYC1_FULL_37_79]OFZ60056.1 MAG: hypothetical protein A2381_17290 [Bdellovibrionales bacterium RIFOXYB1_FULL_37_110]OFZ61354.1 MAG: hypothetical protein A2577_00640 [Bdellovibrionales bacterium RIFOXYD1_FULL_36_51]
MNKSDDSLRDSWASLGIAFNTKATDHANPEQTIIETIKSGEFPGDRKMFGLMLLWLENYMDLVHVERLKYLMKDLSPFQLALLGGIAKKCLSKGDLRFKTIIKEIEKRFGKNSPKFEGDDELYLKLKGVDADFLCFGVKVAPMHADESKKLLKRDQVIKNNAWLRNRLVFGSNLRADFITVFTLGLAQNAYQASKLLSCSANASYRNWKDLEEARGLDFV